MTTRHVLRATGLTALVAAAVSVTAAWAAPARTFTFDSAKTEKYDATGAGIATFSDGSVPIEQCTTGTRECDDTLVELKTPGKLSAKVLGGDPSVVDVALDLFAADSTGKVGKNLKHDDQNASLSEAVSAELDPGFYVIRVDFLTGEGAVNMEAGFAPIAPDATETPAPIAAPPAINKTPTGAIKLPKSIASSKLKAIGGTAGDDGAVAKVAVGVLKKTGKKCTQLNSKGTFTKARSCKAPKTLLAAKGTSTWSLKLKKKFAKGSYTAFAVITDDKGATTTVKAAFKVK